MANGVRKIKSKCCERSKVGHLATERRDRERERNSGERWQKRTKHDSF